MCVCVVNKSNHIDSYDNGQKVFILHQKVSFKNRTIILIMETL